MPLEEVSNGRHNELSARTDRVSGGACRDLAGRWTVRIPCRRSFLAAKAGSDSAGARWRVTPALLDSGPRHVRVVINRFAACGVGATGNSIPAAHRAGEPRRHAIVVGG